MREKGKLSETPLNFIFYSQARIPFFFIDVQEERYTSSATLSIPTMGGSPG